MKDLLYTIIKGLVKQPDAISITEEAPNQKGITVYHLNVDPQDLGRVIGKQGRIAKSIRAVMRAAAIKKGVRVAVEIKNEAIAVKE